MSKLNCIVYYPNQLCYSEINTLSDTNVRRILEAKDNRNELGGRNHYLEQIQQIHENIDVLHHGVHVNPCYKR